MRLPRFLALIGTAQLIASIAVAQGVSTLILEGDAIPGLGNVTTIDKIWINGSGDYLIKVTTDNANAAANEAILMNGVVYLTEGQAMATPGGSSLLTFDAMHANSAGDIVTNVALSGTGSAANDSGVYWNTNLVVQEGDISTSTALSPTTPYVRFDEVQANDNNQVVVIGAIDDFGLPGTIDACITVFDLDASGNVVAENVVIKEADITGNNGSPVTIFGSTPMHYDFNNAGQVMYKVHMATGAGANDVAIYLDTPPYTGGAGMLIAEEASPSPITGRNWSNLANPAMGLNNNGDWVMKGYLDGSSTDSHVIIKNNVKFVQKGDVMASTGGYLIQNFGISPVEIADNGNVLWYGDWDDGNTTQDTGIFLNYDLIVQEGVTTIGTATVKKFSSSAQGHHISDTGSYIIFKAELSNGLEGAFLMGTGEPGAPTCFGDGTGGFCPCGNLATGTTGCGNAMGSNMGTGAGAELGASGSASVSSADISFNVTGLQAFKPTLLISSSSLTATPGALGDGLSCFGSSQTQHGVSWANGGGTAAWTSGQISNPNWTAGSDTFFQAIYRDQNGPCGFGYNSSSAYKVTFVP
jgi:hypothetical protein